MVLRTTAVGLAVLGAALLSASPAHALWTHDIATNLTVCATTGSQSQPIAMADGAGGAFVAWQDTRPPGGVQIYMERVGADGVTLWAGNGIPVLAVAGNGFVTFGGMVSDGAGGVIIGWSDFRSGNFDVYAQRIDGNGLVKWTTNGVAVCSLAGAQAVGGVVSDGAGGAILTWSDARSGTYQDIYAQRIDGNGVAQWATNGVVVCNASLTQYAPVMDTDGAGGAIICWRDLRGNVDTDLYAQRINSSGTPLWTANGIVVSSSINDQTSQCLVADGIGGVIVAWQDARSGGWDIYAQHLTGSGQALWFYTGLAVSTASGDQTLPAMVADGVGGAHLSWIDNQSGTGDVHLQHVSGTGVLLTNPESNYSQAHATTLSNVTTAYGAITIWTHDLGSGYSLFETTFGAGSGYSTASNHELHPAIISDGRGGVILFWDDTRNGDPDIFAQRVDTNGFPGDPSPVITSVADVPNDQGGLVKISWLPSWIDIGYIGSYRIWRSVPTSPAFSARVAGRELTRDAEEAVATGKLWSGPDAATDYAWEFVSSVPDSQPAPATYSFIAPTAYDSIPSSNPLTAFMVQALRVYVPSTTWTSQPASGYSVDNLAPAVPSPLTGTYAAGVTRLHWNPNSEADFYSYRIYRGSTPDFAIGPASLLSVKPDTGFVDNAGAPLYYKVTATDIHSNESAAAQYPTSTTAVEGPGVLSFELETPMPNPARFAAMIRYTLPRASATRLELFDASGRRVRVLHDGIAAAGTHAGSFTLDDATGHPLASGLYLVRLESAGLSLTRRIAVVR